MRRGAAFLLTLLLSPGTAWAGAWTLDRHKIAVFAGVTASQASTRYDGGGSATKPVLFRKLLSQNWMEYGLTDAVTVFAAPEYVLAEMSTENTARSVVHSAAVEAGLRILLLTKIGMLSVQASGKSAGAFMMSTASSGEAGRQIEVRLLYGRGFKLFRRDAYFDIEAAQRWIARPRPDEVVFDASFGWQATANNTLVVQSFNLMASGPVTPPYETYRLHKLQFSLVHRLSRRWSMQSGYFLSVAGRNIVKETGAIAMVWFRT